MNDFHVGDMAAELAEREALLATLDELIKRGTESIHKAWQELATEQPDRVRAIYKSMIGE